MTLAQGFSFSWDFNTATLLAIGVQIVVVIVYLVKTNGKAAAAYQLAEEAKKDVKDLSIQIAATAGNLSLLREQVAREHPDHDALEAMEKRLTREIHRTIDRVDRLLRINGKTPEDDD